MDSLFSALTIMHEPADDQYLSLSYNKVFEEVSRAYRDWQLYTVNLLGFHNYRFKRIFDGKEYRKPKAYFSASITSKGNFALDWFPREYVSPSYEDTGDWEVWETSVTWWPEGGRIPFNRVLFIRGFEKVLQAKKGPIESALILAVSELVERVLDFLSYSIEPIVIDSFVAEHPLGADVYKGKHITGVNGVFNRILEDVGYEERTAAQLKRTLDVLERYAKGEL